MGKLTKYASKSNIMNIKVAYGKETFEFNLDKELRITEHKLTNDVKDQVRSYAFISMLHKKLIIKHKELSKTIKRKKDRLIPMVQAKHKYRTVKEAEANLLKHNKQLSEKEDELLYLEEIKEVLEVAVKSFEYRQDLLRTLSANVRNER